MEPGLGLGLEVEPLRYLVGHLDLVPLQQHLEPAPAEAPPSPWDAVGAVAPAPVPVAMLQEAPPAYTAQNEAELAAAAATGSSPWDSMGTTGGAPTPVMPAQASEMKKAAAAKAVSNSDLF